MVWGDPQDVHVGHESERTYAGYGNALRAVQALARWLEDARFFITERSEASWIDELRIVEGVLAYRRLEIEEVQDEPTLRRRELRKDRELREFLAWRIARELGRGDREGMADRDLHVTARREALAKAEALDPDGHEVLFQRGCIERAAGEHRVALGWFMRASSGDDGGHGDRGGRPRDGACVARSRGDRAAGSDGVDPPRIPAWPGRGLRRGRGGAGPRSGGVAVDAVRGGRAAGVRRMLGDLAGPARWAARSRTTR